MVHKSQVKTISFVVVLRIHSMLAIMYVTPYFHSVLMFGYCLNEILNKYHIFMISHVMAIPFDDIFKFFIKRI